MDSRRRTQSRGRAHAGGSAQLRGEHARRTIAVCGILGDKDIEGIVDGAASSFDAWIVVGLAAARARRAGRAWPSDCARCRCPRRGGRG